MQTVKGVKVRCIKLLKNKVYKFARYNYSLYVKKWSEITNEVERRLKYLLDKLKIERATLSKSQSLNEVMNEVSNNTAAMVS